ncbi:hypothetical protein [Streptomyces sp. HPF1205]|uniref:hypothetical protein n=1 Tax=Streptomyces sp. HPF1205 TaxID=2873262 RepID=UPI001CECA17A|nr:hypothetical protein [Streptomyces sp. HPF1205]
MDASTITILTDLANKAIAREKKAREDLAARLTDTSRLVDGSDYRHAARAAGQALPYRMLLEDAEGEDFATAFNRLRKRLTRQLLSTGDAQTSCAMTNEIERQRFAGYRDFLAATDMYTD